MLDTATRAVLDDLLRQEPLAGDTVPGKTSAYKLVRLLVLMSQLLPSGTYSAKSVAEPTLIRSFVASRQLPLQDLPGVRR